MPWLETEKVYARKGEFHLRQQQPPYFHFFLIPTFIQFHSYPAFPCIRSDFADIPTSLFAFMVLKFLLFHMAHSFCCPIFSSIRFTFCSLQLNEKPFYHQLDYSIKIVLSKMKRLTMPNKWMNFFIAIMRCGAKNLMESCVSGLEHWAVKRHLISNFSAYFWLICSSADAYKLFNGIGAER